MREFYALQMRNLLACSVPKGGSTDEEMMAWMAGRASAAGAGGHTASIVVDCRPNAQNPFEQDAVVDKKMDIRGKFQPRMDPYANGPPMMNENPWEAFLGPVPRRKPNAEDAYKKYERHNYSTPEEYESHNYLNPVMVTGAFPPVVSANPPFVAPTPGERVFSNDSLFSGTDRETQAILQEHLAAQKKRVAAAAQRLRDIANPVDFLATPAPPPSSSVQVNSRYQAVKNKLRRQVARMRPPRLAHLDIATSLPPIEEDEEEDEGGGGEPIRAPESMFDQ
jgi:hypothetical protein